MYKETIYKSFFFFKEFTTPNIVIEWVNNKVIKKKILCAIALEIMEAELFDIVLISKYK